MKKLNLHKWLLSFLYLVYLIELSCFYSYTPWFVAIRLSFSSEQNLAKGEIIHFQDKKSGRISARFCSIANLRRRFNSLRMPC